VIDENTDKNTDKMARERRRSYNNGIEMVGATGCGENL